MERNTDPKTRYRVELACGHTVVRQYPPTMTKGVCSQCDAPCPSSHGRTPCWTSAPRPTSPPDPRGTEPP